MFLPTGTEWGGALDSGLGSLRVENGTRQDAVAVLFEGGSTTEVGTAQRAIYVQAGDTATLKDIAPGAYTLRFSLGIDWSEDAHRFRDSPSYYEFVDTVQFEETRAEDGTVTFHRERVTLHRVRGGNALTSRIDPSKFDLSTLVSVLPRDK